MTHDPSLFPGYIREKRNVALSSVAAAVFLTGIKFIVGIQTNSLGILSEAAHSALDLIAAVLTLVAVRIADRPPDEEHQYGHGKIENVSALLQTILLFITCAWIIWEAVQRLVGHESHIEATGWSFAVMAVAIAVDISRSRALSKIARKHRSQALEADALHFSSDVWSSLVVVFGLVFVSLGFPAVDAVAAIGVALLVLFVSYRLGRRTIDALMDRVPGGLYERIHRIIEQVDGVEQLRSIRLRPSGSTIYADAVVAIRRTTPFEQAHAIVDRIETAIRDAYPNVEAVIHAEPFESMDETLVDKIRMIVLRRGLRAPHNLEVHSSNGRYHIDFDLEYRRGQTFDQAHEMANEIEEEIRKAFPAAQTVTIHMEEYQPTETELTDVTEREGALREEIRAAVLQNRNIRSCSGVTLLKSGRVYNVLITCEVDRTKTLEQVHHVISETEGNLYKKFKQLRRVTMHAEPV